MKNLGYVFFLFSIFLLGGLAVNHLLTSGALTSFALALSGLITVGCGGLLAYEFDRAPQGTRSEGAFMALMLVFPLSSQGLFAAAQAFRGIPLDTIQDALRLYAVGAFFLAFLVTFPLKDSRILSRSASGGLRFMRKRFPLFP